MCCDRFKWTDAHFCSLDSQTNVYTLSTIEHVVGTSDKILVSSISGEVVAIEYQQQTHGLKPCTRRINFTYIPGDAEIVSIDAFTNDKSQTLVVGITFLKIAKASSPTVSGRYLNIYLCWQPDKGKDLDSIAESCQHIDLDYTPYQLTHTSVYSGDAWHQVFLLSGSDNRIHVYSEDSKQSQFEEINSDDFFPEFANLESCVIWMDLVNIDNNRQRLTAIGHQSGQLSVFVVNIGKCETNKHFTTTFDGPITTVLLFTDTNNEVAKPDFLSSLGDCAQSNLPLAEPVYHLLVTASIDTSVVYRDVVHEGVDVIMPLPDSDLYDIVTCACVVDVDFDGHKEIVLGTYGQELLVYKYFPAHQLINKDPEADKFVIRRCPTMPYTPPLLDSANKLRHKSSDIPPGGFGSSESPGSRRARSQEDLSGAANHTTSSVPSVSSKGSLSSEDDLFYAHDTYKRLWKMSFSKPILAVDHMDITGDGVREVVVATLNGVHILQPDLNKVAQLCEQRLKTFTEKLKLSDKT